ncbi:MAG: hypothetical protein ACREOZ_03780 [Gloeomargaritales cyanobacterium]
MERKQRTKSLAYREKGFNSILRTTRVEHQGRLHLGWFIRHDKHRLKRERRLLFEVVYVLSTFGLEEQGDATACPDCYAHIMHACR